MWFYYIPNFTSDIILLVIFFCTILRITIILIIVTFLSQPSLSLNFSKLSSYECGFKPFHDIYTKPFFISYTLIRLRFLLFDVELVVLLPLNFRRQIKIGKIRILTVRRILSILFISWLYEWLTGGLEFSGVNNDSNLVSSGSFINKDNKFIFFSTYSQILETFQNSFGGNAKTHEEWWQTKKIFSDIDSKTWILNNKEFSFKKERLRLRLRIQSELRAGKLTVTTWEYDREIIHEGYISLSEVVDDVLTEKRNEEGWQIVVPYVKRRYKNIRNLNELEKLAYSSYRELIKQFFEIEINRDNKIYAIQSGREPVTWETTEYYFIRIIFGVYNSIPWLRRSVVVGLFVLYSLVTFGTISYFLINTKNLDRFQQFINGIPTILKGNSIYLFENLIWNRGSYVRVLVYSFVPCVARCCYYFLTKFFGFGLYQSDYFFEYRKYAEVSEIRAENLLGTTAYFTQLEVRRKGDLVKQKKVSQIGRLSFGTGQLLRIFSRGFVLRWLILVRSFRIYCYGIVEERTLFLILGLRVRIVRYWIISVVLLVNIYYRVFPSKHNKYFKFTWIKRCLIRGIFGLGILVWRIIIQLSFIIITRDTVNIINSKFSRYILDFNTNTFTRKSLKVFEHNLAPDQIIFERSGSGKIPKAPLTKTRRDRSGQILTRHSADEIKFFRHRKTIEKVTKHVRARFVERYLRERHIIKKTVGKFLTIYVDTTQQWRYYNLLKNCYRSQFEMCHQKKIVGKIRNAISNTIKQTGRRRSKRYALGQLKSKAIIKNRGFIRFWVIRNT